MRRFLGLALVPVFSIVAMTSAWPADHGATTVLAVGEMCTPARPHAAGTSVNTISTTSGVRSYRLHVPASYTGDIPVPIVLGFHGAGSNAFEQEAYSGFSPKSESEGFIAVYPDGKVNVLGFTTFNAWQLATPDDVGFVNALLDSLEAQLCTDRSRVYSAGISNGAMMSVRLACSLSSRIAAIAPVAGAYYPPNALNLNPAENCLDTRSMPVIAFHGTADDTVPFLGGVGGSFFVDYRLPLDNTTPDEDVMDDWAIHDGCTGSRQESQIDTEVRLIEYSSCTDGALVQLYAVDGGGHTWPGSFDVPSLGYTTHQIIATDLIWTFFTGYTLPDIDLDLFPDTVDNCPSDANFSQQNNDRNHVDNSPPYATTVDDKTWPHSDTAGDACDPDDDNDGRTDADEGTGAWCGGVPSDPLLADSDSDRALDWAECLLGKDPTSAASQPTLEECGVPGDTDGDKIANRIEFCYYNSSLSTSDTDDDKGLDGATDGCEIASINTDRIVSSGDQGMLAGGISGAFAYHPNIDLDKSGVLNSGDQGLMASFIIPAGQCPG